jgi:hypothetical protein
VKVAWLLVGLWVNTASFAQQVSDTSTTDRAHPIWLNAGMYSLHFDTDQGFRNNNTGFGAEVSLNEDWSATAGRFINSDNAQSNYVGAYYQPWHVGQWKAGVVGGGFNGYPRMLDGGWFPALLPVVTLEGERLGVNLLLVPPLKDRLYGALSVQLKLRIGP